MGNQNKNKQVSLLEKIGLVQRIDAGNNKQIRSRKKEHKLYIITCIITIVIYSIIDYVGNLDLNGKLISVKTLYFFVIWIILFSIVRLILVSTVFKNKN